LNDFDVQIMAETQILMTLSEIVFVSRTRNAATRCVLRAYNAAKCDCGRGSPRSRCGILQRSSRPPSWLRVAASQRGGEGRREREGEEEEGKGG